MVWDHLFGTYQHENDKIIFGVVSPHPNTFDMLTLQFGYYKLIIEKMKQVDGIENKLYCLIKGPGWSPGKPRLGLITDVPEPDKNAPKYSYDPYCPFWIKVYVAAHGFLMFVGFYIISDHHLMVSKIILKGFLICFIFPEEFMA